MAPGPPSDRIDGYFNGHGWSWVHPKLTRDIVLRYNALTGRLIDPKLAVLCNTIARLDEYVGGTLAVLGNPASVLREHLERVRDTGMAPPASTV